jgi:hypothetical protein
MTPRWGPRAVRACSVGRQGVREARRCEGVARGTDVEGVADAVGCAARRRECVPRGGASACREVARVRTARWRECVPRGARGAAARRRCRARRGLAQQSSAEAEVARNRREVRRGAGVRRSFSGAGTRDRKGFEVRTINANNTLPSIDYWSMSTILKEACVRSLSSLQPNGQHFSERSMAVRFISAGARGRGPWLPGVRCISCFVRHVRGVLGRFASHERTVGSGRRCVHLRAVTTSESTSLPT